MYYQILIKDAFQEPAPRLLSFTFLFLNPSLDAVDVWLGRGLGLVFCWLRDGVRNKFQING